MSSHNRTIAFIAVVVLTAGVWWALPERGPELREDLPAPTNAIETDTAGSPALPTAVPPVVVGDSPRSDPNEEPPRVIKPPSTSFAWPKGVLEFANQADTDPAVSRELESEIQRSLVTKLHPSSYEVDSVTCRGRDCQILSHERIPRTGDQSVTASGAPAAGEEWRSAIGRLLSEFTDVPIRTPGTDEALKPKLRDLTQYMSDPTGFVVTISFEKS